jgi:hypothetical protein
MKNKYQWYKYREYTAGGVGEWKYIHVPYDYFMPHQDRIDEEYLDRKGLLCTWSEHFRRVEIKKAGKVPEKIVQEKIKEITGNLKDYNEELKMVRRYQRK